MKTVSLLLKEDEEEEGRRKGKKEEEEEEEKSFIRLGHGGTVDYSEKDSPEANPILGSVFSHQKAVTVTELGELST